VEVRAKLPIGVGTWPAIWMLGKNINENGAYWDLQGFGTKAWPACGEIDIMEHWGDNQGFVQSAIHTPSSFGGTVNKGGKTVSTVSTDFHLYTFEWTSEKLVFSVDNAVYYTYNPAIKDATTWPFDAEQYLLLNVAIQSGIAQNFTQSTMEIDYVRVYQAQTTSIVVADIERKTTIYPNPFQDNLTINLGQAKQQSILIKIYNSNGQLVLKSELPNILNQVKINNLGHLPSGLYTVVYEVEGEIQRINCLKH
jgi:beta-glucanase (GH16 family)